MTKRRQRRSHSLVLFLTIPALAQGAARGDDEPGPAMTVSASAYGGFGSTDVGHNEGWPSTYRVGYGGLAVDGVVALGGPPADGPPTGWTLRLGAVGELRSQKLTHCTSFCDYMVTDPRPERHGALRAGATYEWQSIGVRLGVLYADAQRAQLAQDPLLLPDIAVRIGARERLHGSIGAGAYDGATSLRPGIYFEFIGGWEAVQLTGHLGLHSGLDRFSGSVLNLEPRVALGAAVPLGRSTRLEGGAATGGRTLELYTSFALAL